MITFLEHQGTLWHMAAPTRGRLKKEKFPQINLNNMQWRSGHDIFYCQKIAILVKLVFLPKNLRLLIIIYYK